NYYWQPHDAGLVHHSYIHEIAERLCAPAHMAQTSLAGDGATHYRLLDLRREQHLASAEDQAVPGGRDDDLVHAHVRGGFRDEAHDAPHVLHLKHARLVFGRRRFGSRLLQRCHRLARMDGAAADPVHAFLDVDLVYQRAQRLLARVVRRAADIGLIAREPGRD